MNDIPINDVTKETVYFAGRGAIYAGAKGSSETIASSIAQVLPKEVTTGISNVAKAFGMGAGDGVIGVIAIGLTAAISAALTMMDYNHKRTRLKDLYKDELAAVTGKDKGKVTVADMETLAKSNGVINEELNRSKKQRNFGVFISFAASMVALSVVTFALPAMVAGLGLPVLAASFTSLTGLGMIAVNGAVAFAAYHFVKDPLHKVADKLFHIDEKTTNDHIVAMTRDHEAGKLISREQVLSAFVQAHPELDQMIVANYGKHFDDLPLADKQRAVQDLNQLIPLDRLTVDINSGRIHATELAFAVENKSSGVVHEGHERPELHKHGLRGMAEKISAKINHSKLGHDVERVAADALAPEQEITPITQVNESPAQTFVERFGLSKKAQMTHVERIEQGRDGQTVALQ